MAIYWVFISSDTFCLSFPANTLLCVSEVYTMCRVNVMGELRRSGNH